MAKKLEIQPEQKLKAGKAKEASQKAQISTSQDINDLASLQQQVGNRAVQRLVAQRKGSDPFELDEKTAGRISQARGGGQKLDEGVQSDLGQKMGADFSDVRVHTGQEAGALNQQLNARAFTTGSDIFFSPGSYNPTSSEGQELLSHELAHVVQQNSGKVEGGSGGMTVRPPGDAFEQQADATARSVNQGVQRQEDEETSAELGNSLEEEDKEDVQTAPIQRVNLGSSRSQTMSGIEEDEELANRASQSTPTTSTQTPAADTTDQTATQAPEQSTAEQEPSQTEKLPSNEAGSEQKPEEKPDEKAKQTEDMKDKLMPDDKLIGEKLPGKDEEEEKK